MLYVIFGLKFDIQFEKLCEMHDKSIENCHVENVVLGKDFNLSMIGFFFMFSPKCDGASNVLEFFSWFVWKQWHDKKDSFEKQVK